LAFGIVVSKYTVDENDLLLRCVPWFAAKKVLRLCGVEGKVQVALYRVVSRRSNRSLGDSYNDPYYEDYNTLHQKQPEPAWSIQDTPHLEHAGRQ